MAPSPIKNVLVIGASGSVGRSTINALLAENFQVTGLTRESSKAALPAGVRHIKTDYSEASLIDAFRGQDAVVSALGTIVPGDVLLLQKTAVDAAVAAGVNVFFPSEYGIDTSDRAAANHIPFLADKIEIVDHLKAKQDKISWTALITGSIFDWSLKIPGFGGWDLPARSVTIFDGGNIPYEATNLDQVGRAIAKCLQEPELTKNKYVYVNSFTVTQNEVLKAVEKATGERFAVSQGSVEELWQDGAAKVKHGQPLGALGMIAGAVYGRGGLAHYSVTKGLWNDRLGLPQQDLDAFFSQGLVKP